MNKLVRVNLGIPEERLTYLDFNSKEALEYIKKKVVEEAQEVFEARSRDEIILEVGDLLDVVDLYLEANGIDPEKVMFSRMIKNQKKGRLINLETNQVPILDKKDD